MPLRIMFSAVSIAPADISVINEGSESKWHKYEILCWMVRITVKHHRRNSKINNYWVSIPDNRQHCIVKYADRKRTCLHNVACEKNCTRPGTLRVEARPSRRSWFIRSKAQAIPSAQDSTLRDRLDSVGVVGRGTRPWVLLAMTLSAFSYAANGPVLAGGIVITMAY